MRQFLLVALMFLGGIGLALQPSINSRLAQRTGVLESACISFLVGTLSLFFLLLCSGRQALGGIRDASWWELTGGLLGAFFVPVAILAVPRIGTGAAMTAVIAAQLATGLLLDHYGLFGLRHIPLDLPRLAGVGLLLTGASLLLWR
jgi:transporter family-2 protein